MVGRSNEGGMTTLPSTVKVYSGIITTGVFLGGLVVNLSALLTVALYVRASRSSIFFILVNLFVCNLLLSTFEYPVTGLNIIQHWPDWQCSATLCKWSSLCENVCSSVVVFILLLLSIDRYYVTVQRRELPSKMIGVLSVLIWVACATLHGIYSFDSTNPSSETHPQTQKNITVCNAFSGKPLTDGQLGYSRSAIANIACFVVTLAIILRVGIDVWRGKIQGHAKTRKIQREEFKIAFIVIVFAVVFFLPKFSVTIIRSRHVTVRARIVVLTQVLGSINSVMAGIVCIMFSKDFRRATLDMVRGCAQSRLRVNHGAGRDRQQNDMKEPLTTKVPLTHENNDCTSNNNPQPKFIKGRFKSCHKEIDMCSVSIDSQTLEEEAGPGQKNKIYEPSCKGEELFEHIDSKF